MIKLSEAVAEYLQETAKKKLDAVNQHERIRMLVDWAVSLEIPLHSEATEEFRARLRNSAWGGMVVLYEILCDFCDMQLCDPFPGNENPLTEPSSRPNIACLGCGWSGTIRGG